MEPQDRTDWRQNPDEQAASVKVIAQLEAAIIAAPKTNPEYSGEERRKAARATRRETLARCLVTLNTVLASLEATGSLDDSAKVWLIEGLDAPPVLKYDAYYDGKGQVVIPEWRIAACLQTPSLWDAPVTKGTQSAVSAPEDEESEI